MPYCRKCDRFIRNGDLCREHRLEHKYGVPSDNYDDDEGDDDDGSGDEWTVEQQSLDGDTHSGQATLDGGVTREVDR